MIDVIEKARDLINQNKKDFDLRKKLSGRKRRSISELKNIKKAQNIVNEHAYKVQTTIKYVLTDIVNHAMQSILDEPYELVLDFVPRRGKTEAEFYLTNKDGDRIKPNDAIGGGVLDVLSITLRIALWNMKEPKTRNVLILDEPLKSLKGGEMPNNGARLLKEISDNLGIQIIMVSHDQEIIESADRVFQIFKNEIGTSVIKQIK